VWAAQVKEMLTSNHLWKKLNEVPPSAMIRAANHGKEDTHKQREELTDKISKLRRAHTEMLQPDTDMQNEELDQWHDAPNAWGQLQMWRLLRVVQLNLMVFWVQSDEGHFSLLAIHLTVHD